jgi:hypothetical protein
MGNDTPEVMVSTEETSAVHVTIPVSADSGLAGILAGRDTGTAEELANLIRATPGLLGKILKE